MEEAERELREAKAEHSKLKTLLDPKRHSRSRRENTPTTLATVQDNNSSVRYRRRQETKDALEFIHGGEQGSVFGAWDFVAANATTTAIDEFICNYKRGRYLKGLLDKAVKEHNSTVDALHQAVAVKYQNFLSRRKFNLLCKTQASAFDPDKEVWVPRNVKVLGVDIRNNVGCISNERVDKFVKDLDIGHVNQIPNVPGVSRTVSGLVFMIIDLHLRLPYLARELIWFNENTNHFVFQFSDDGAPETSELSMSIGSLTSWNLGERLSSREYQYLLHCASVNEKDEVCELLWQQHTDEMLLLESSVFQVNGVECTMEFQPSAYMCWQSWAANEVNQAATHPSPYANVHKGNLTTMGGSIGFDKDNLWKPYSSSVRKEHLKQVEEYLSTLPSGISKKNRHDKRLAFMAEKGIRQLGEPRIGVFADRMRPDPLHCEINAWQHILDIIYIESIQRGEFQSFISVLCAPVHSMTQNDDIVPSDDNAPSEDNVPAENMIQCSELDINAVMERANKKFVDALEEFSANHVSNQATQVQGCGLQYLASRIKEHYADEAKRFNKLPVRRIGRQTLALSRYVYRLIDAIQETSESPPQRIRRLALSKIAQYLRDAAGLFNRINVSLCPGYIDQLSEYCELYFNLFSLFFPNSVNITVWTVGYAIPYHAKQIYDKYNVGYGIISLQAKESKHAGIKAELNLTNRSKETNTNGKWWQIMRSDFVRTVYLPEHQATPSSQRRVKAYPMMQHIE